MNFLSSMQYRYHFAKDEILKTNQSLDCGLSQIRNDLCLRSIGGRALDFTSDREHPIGVADRDTDLATALLASLHASHPWSKCSAPASSR